MSGLRFRPIGHDPETEAVGRFASDFATSIGVSFPVDETAVDRVRTQVLEAFAAGAASLAERGVQRPSRRWAVAGLAASAGLMVVAAVASQTDPGETLYPVRIGIESAMVPRAEEPAGWAIRLHRLQDRMHDGIVAARDGQAAAVDMALGEYRAELDRLKVAMTVDPSRRAELIATISADLGWVEDLQRTYHVAAADLLIADIHAVIAAEAPPGVLDDPASPAAPTAGGGSGIGNDQADGDASANGHPNASGAGGANGNAGGNRKSNASATGQAHADARSAAAAAGGATQAGVAPTVAPTATPATVADPTPAAPPTPSRGNAGGNGNGNSGGNGNGNAADRTPKPDKTPKP